MERHGASHSSPICYGKPIFPTCYNSANGIFQTTYTQSQSNMAKSFFPCTQQYHLQPIACIAIPETQSLMQEPRALTVVYICFCRWSLTGLAIATYWYMFLWNANNASKQETQQLVPHISCTSRACIYMIHHDVLETAHEQGPKLRVTKALMSKNYRFRQFAISLYMVLQHAKQRLVIWGSIPIHLHINNRGTSWSAVCFSSKCGRNFHQNSYSRFLHYCAPSASADSVHLFGSLGPSPSYIRRVVRCIMLSACYAMQMFSR